jgi:hypothetical protein
MTETTEPPADRADDDLTTETETEAAVETGATTDAEADAEFESGSTSDFDVEETDESESGDEGEGRRTVAFETAADALANVFELDRRSGETITDLETSETGEERQLVATVERSRSAALRHRLASAKRTGRRVGSGAAVLGVLAATAYVVLTLRRFLGDGKADDADHGDSYEGAATLDEPHAIDESSDESPPE